VSATPSRDCCSLSRRPGTTGSWLVETAAEVATAALWLLPLTSGGGASKLNCWYSPSSSASVGSLGSTEACSWARILSRKKRR